MSSNTNIGNTPVNQGYVQLIHTGETGGIDGTLRTLYDGDGTASDLQIASNKVKISTELYIGSKTITEYVQDVVGDMFDTNGSHTNITATYDDDGDGAIDLVSTGEVTLTGTETLTNKTLASPTFTGTANGDNLTLTGDLTVSGDTIFTNSNNVLIGDAILTLNADETGSPTANAGFEVERGTSTNKSFLWNETDDKWTIGSETFVAGTVEGNLTGNVTGNVTGSASLNLLKSNNLSDLASASTARSNLGVSIGSDVQAYDAGLQSISGLTTAADKMIYTTASDTYAVTALTSTARTLLDDTSIGAMQTTLGLGTLATQNTIDFDDINGTAYITSAEAFSDSDLQLMTAAAIDDLIISKGYGTGNGDITAVNAGVGIGGGGLSGDVDLTFEGSELPDMTDLMVSTDEFVVLDGTTSKRKAISEIRLTAFDDTGFTSGISFNGSTANGLLTYGNSTTADVESNLTFDGSDKTLLLDGTGASAELATFKWYQNEVQVAGAGTGNAQNITLNATHGTTLNTLYRYKITLTTRGTGTDTGAVYIVSYDEPNTTWIARMVSRAGSTSNHPLLNISGSNAQAYHNHSSTYYIAYSVESKYVRESDGTFHNFGADYHWQRDVDTLSYSDGDVNIDSNTLFVDASTDRVGIGVSNPARTLEVAGAIEISGNDNTLDTNNFALRRDSGGGGNIDVPGNMTINLDANNNETTAQFEICHDAGSTPVFKVQENGYTTALRYYLEDTGAVIYRNNNDLELITYSGYDINLMPSGNVGIGTNSPAGKLDVVPDTDGYSRIGRARVGYVGFADYAGFSHIDRANVSQYAMIQQSDGATFINSASGTPIYFRESNATKMILTGGNVGIGTQSPQDKLHIEGTTSSTRMRVKTTTGSAEARLITSNGDWILSSSGSSNQFQIYNATTSSTYFAIDSNGDVGIGGGTTSFKLDVQGGSARISSGGLGVGVNPSGTTGRGDFSNDVIAYSTSDKRLKENIKPLDSALDKVLKISGVEFDWKELTEEEKETIHGNEGHDVGVIAQEIEEVLPEVVTTRESGYKAVKYEKIVPLLIEAIKEQQKQIEELKNG